MASNLVHWFEIYVQDMERAKKFYEGVFQVKLERINNPNDFGAELWSFPMEKDRVGAGGALVKMQGVQSGGNSTIVYFTSADCTTEEGRVVKLGGEIQKNKTSIAPYGFISLVFDTEGNMIGLHSME